MANTALLSGLGAALQSFGGSMSDQARQKAKDELAQKLELEREKRAQEREIAKEERAAKRLDSTITAERPQVDEEGVLWIQPVNAAGQARGERRLANAQENLDHKYTSDTKRLTLENLTSQAAVNAFKQSRLTTEAAQADAEHEADMGYRRAATEAQRASAQRSRTTALESELAPKTEDDYTQFVLDLGEDIISDYTGTQANPGTLSNSEINAIAADLARAGVREGRVPTRAELSKALQDAAALKKPSKTGEGNTPVVRFMGY